MRITKRRSQVTHTHTPQKTKVEMNRDRRRKPKINRMRMRMRIKCECTIPHAIEWNQRDNSVAAHIRRNDVQRCYSVNSARFHCFFSLVRFFLSSCFFAYCAFVLLCLLFFSHFIKLFRVQPFFLLFVSFVCFSLFRTRCRCLKTKFGCMQLYHYHYKSYKHIQFHGFHKAKAVNAIFFGMHCYFVIHNAHFMYRCRRRHRMKCQNNGHGNKLMAL